MLLSICSDTRRVARFTLKKGRNVMMNLMTRLWKEEEGQDLIEYALLIALIALAATVGMGSLATKINTEFNNLGLDLTSAT
jgi:pilus assembly protein Flp/PilA